MNPFTEDAKRLIQDTGVSYENIKTKIKQKTKLTLRQYAIGDAGQCNINLVDGSFYHEVNLCTIKENILEVPLNLVFYMNLFNGTTKERGFKYINRGFKTNFHQRVFKDQNYNSNSESLDTTYVDGQGIYHVFKERWSYEENGEKKYKDKKDVYLDDDNKLKYQGYEVKYEPGECDDLVLISVDGLYNYPKKEHIILRKRYYILLKDQDNKEYKKYVYIDKDNNIHVPNYFYCPDFASDDLTFDKKQYLPYKDIQVIDGKLKYNDNYVFSVEDIIVPLSNSTASEISFRRGGNGESFEEQVHVETISDNKLGLDDSAYLDEDFNNVNIQIQQLEQQISQVEELLSNYQKQIKDCFENQNTQNTALKYKDLSKEHRNSMEELDKVTKKQEDHKYQYYLQSDKYDTSLTLSSFESINNQIDNYVSECDKLVKQINEYTNLKNKLETYKAGLIANQRSSINTIIKDSNNNILGFDENGRLVLIQDEFDNYIVIEFAETKNSDQIKTIYSENEKITFEYNDKDLLERIITPKGTIILFNYDGDCITNVSINDRTIKFNYLESNSKLDIYDSLENRLIIQFSDKVEQVAFMKSSVILTSSGGKSRHGTEEVLYEHVYFYDGSFKNIKDYAYGVMSHEYYFDENNNLILFNDNNGHIIFKHYNDLDLIDYYCEKQTNYRVYSEKEVTFSGDISFSIGNETTKDINTFFLNQTKIVGILLESKDLLGKTIEVRITANNAKQTTPQVRYHLANLTSRIVLLPFILSLDDLTQLNVNIIASGASGTIQIVRIDGCIYSYDENNRVIMEEQGAQTVNYLAYVDDKPTRIATIDEFERRTNTSINYDHKGNIIYTLDPLGMCNRFFYNDKNQLIETMSYPNNEPTLVDIENYQYDEKGNLLLDYETIPNTSLIRSNKIENYGYDYLTDQLTSISCVVNGVNNKVNYHYKYDLLTRLDHGDLVYNFTYDSIGRIQNIKISGDKINLYEFSYANHIKYLPENVKDYDYFSEVKIINGDNVTKVIYNQENRIYEITKNDKALIYNYDEEGQLVSILDEAHRIIHSYMYNSYNKLYMESDDDKSIYYGYDKYHRMTRKDYSTKYSNNTLTYEYVNDLTTLIKKIDINNSVAISYKYNYLQQVTKETIELVNTSLTFINEYCYLKKEKNTTNLITQQIIKLNNNNDDVITYEYDDRGNIISMISKQNSVYYHYDALNRLVREDNLALGKTNLITYDDRGNILTIKLLGFTTESNDLFKASTIQKYAYASDGWLDQLINYNDKEILYDSVGKPLSYNGYEIIYNIDGTIKEYNGNTYVYNNFGQRIAKTNSLGKYEFVYEGTKLLFMSINGREPFIYRYANEQLIGFSLENKEYIYKKDLLGNITHIIDENGQVIAQYLYDAWGNHKVINNNGQVDTDKESIGNLNPFRYKGYFFDVETQLYWVSSRYYSPELCRWISPDSIEYLDPQSINGLNLYCYCFNNPVNYVDPDGHMPFLCALLILGAIGMVANVGSQALTDLAYRNEFKWENYLVAAGAGFLGGMCYAIPGVGSIVSAAVTSGLTTAGQMAVSGEDYDGWDYLIMAGGSAVLSGLTAWGFGKLSNNMAFFKDSNFILDNFTKFATNYGGITLKPTVILQAAGQIAIRETVAGFVGAPLSGIPGYFDRVYRLNKLGLSPADSFRYAF